MPTTWTGLERWVIVPSPSWPLRFSPQAQTVPSLLSATLKKRPPATAITPARPVTCDGFGFGVVLVVPLPS